MTTMFVTLICIYHAFLRTVGKILGLLFAGLFVGFMQGTKDVKDMYKYLAYRAMHKQQQLKKKEGDDEQDSDNDS